MIKPLSECPDEGRVLRAIVGMLVKRRTADAERLEICKEKCDVFLTRYDVGVTWDGVSGVYSILITPREKGQIDDQF